MKRILYILCSSLLIVTIFLLSLETLLQISSLVYTKSRKYIINNNPNIQAHALRIMFIGDSWTTGSDAPIGSGYMQLTLKNLRLIYPDRDIQGYNFAYGSTNSSQAIHQLLDNYHNIKPNILVILTGINNGWNTQDVITASKRIRNEINIYNKEEAVQFYEKIINYFRKLKTIKLYNLILYNIVYKAQEIKIPLPANEYATGYYQVFDSTRDPEKARLYLIDNYKKHTENYNDLYKLMLHSFGGNIRVTLDYLKTKDFLRLDLIKNSIDIYGNEKIQNSAFEILEDNLLDLQLICKQKDIIMVVQNYPYLKFPQLLRALNKIANKLKFNYVDHYGYFASNISYEKWKQISTMSHVNYEGHRYMADNLTVALKNIIKKIPTK